MEDISDDKACEIENILKEGRFKFAIKYLDKFMKINPKRNIVFSPPSIYKGLLLTCLIAKGEIEERLRNILFLAEISKLDLKRYGEYKTCATYESGDYPQLCKYKAACYIKSDIRLDNDLCLFHFLHGTILKLHMPRNCEQHIEYINDKVLKQAVNHYIHDTESLTVVGQDIEFILMIAICSKFEYLTDAEEDKLLFDTDNESMLERVYDKKRFSYFHHKLNMHVNELFYQEKKISLFVFRPKVSGEWMVSKDANTDICALIQQLSTSEGLCELRKVLDRSTLLRRVPTPFTLQPVFEIEQNLTISELLQTLGAEQLLTRNEIDVDGSSTVEGNTPRVRIGRIVHRSRVKVTKEDIRTGAMTLIHTGQESCEATETVNANYSYPFMWLIYDRQRREILFVGAFNKFVDSTFSSNDKRSDTNLF